MKFSEMMQKAKADGVASEKTMWKSFENLDELLCLVREEHPDEYNKFMRWQHETMYGPHYNEDFAMCDMKGVSYIEKSGEKREGAYWTCEQIENATKSMTFPSGTTKYDKYIAFNVMRSDLCTVMTDEDILRAAHKFFFADIDGPSGKVWVYMTAMKYAKA